MDDPSRPASDDAQQDPDRTQQDPDYAVIGDRLPGGDWQVDPHSSQVNFRARTLFGLLPVNGFFAGFDGALSVAGDGRAHGTLHVHAATIQTGIDGRDRRLRAREFLDADAHPEITFALEEVTGAPPDRLELAGTLELGGRRLPLRFPVTAISHGDHIHIEAKVRIDHRAAGLGFARPGLVGPRLRVELALTLRQICCADATLPASVDPRPVDRGPGGGRTSRRTRTPGAARCAPLSRTRPRRSAAWRSRTSTRCWRVRSSTASTRLRSLTGAR